MKQPKLISCRVMVDEILQFLPENIETEILEISLHTNPKNLNKKLQEVVDRSDGLFDPIYLGYGMCSKATVGLKAKHAHLIVPKTDDCIGIFLGSQETYRKQMMKDPGTYFLTSGWIGDGTGSPFSDYERMVAKYGVEKAERLLSKMLRHYKRLAYIYMPGSSRMKKDRVYAREIACKFNLEYVEIEGTTKLLRKLASRLVCDDLIVVEPGEEITIDQFISR